MICKDCNDYLDTEGLFAKQLCWICKEKCPKCGAIRKYFIESNTHYCAHCKEWSTNDLERGYEKGCKLPCKTLF